MKIYLDTEIKKLRSVINEISKLAESQVFEAMNTLISGQALANKDLKKAENKIDKLDEKIDQICQTIVALQQPVASDLRFVLSAMQIGNEVERIGDLAIDIINKTKEIEAKDYFVAEFGIDSITKDVEAITVNTNEYFKNLDPGKKTIEDIFDLNGSIKGKIELTVSGIIEVMKKDSKLVASGTNLVMILEHLDRISDHCTNIAESIYFVVTAKLVKHQRFESKK